MSKPQENYNELVFKHKVPIQIRFDDLDPMGHVNNAVLISYFDYGKVKYFNAAAPKSISLEKAPYVVVHYETDFYEAVFANEEIFVETKMIRFGEKSIHILQRIVCGEKVKCICKTIMSGINHQTQSSQNIPEEFKNQIIQYEA